MSKVNFIKSNVDIIKTLLKYIPVAELFKSEIVVINQYFCQVNCHQNSKYLYDWKKNLVSLLKYFSSNQKYLDIYKYHLNFIQKSAANNNFFSEG